MPDYKNVGITSAGGIKLAKWRFLVRGGDGRKERRKSAPEKSEDKKCACRGVSLENAKVKSYSPTVLQKGLFAYIVLHSSYNR